MQNIGIDELFSPTQATAQYLFRFAGTDVLEMTLDPQEATASWPRLSHLFRYMGEKLVCGEIDQLNEYNIATEVLGRSKTIFNASEDAIAFQLPAQVTLTQYSGPEK